MDAAADLDARGNLVYRKSARNFNPMVATCGAVTIAELEEVVETVPIDPDGVHTPGIFVTHLICSVRNAKRIEQRVTR